jgi:hypothetical protein
MFSCYVSLLISDFVK